MTVLFPLSLASASSIGTIPTLALVLVALLALFAALAAHSIEQSIQRLSLAGVEDLIEEGHGKARALYALVDHRRRSLLSLRAFRTFWQVVFAVSGTLILVDTALPWWVIALVAILVIGVLQLFFISFIPSQWAARNPEGIALAGSGFTSRLVAVSHIFDPIFTRLRASRPAPTPSEEQVRADVISDLREIVDEVGEIDSFEDEDREMVRSVLDLGHTLVREVMVPRTDMVTIDAREDAPSALRLFTRSGFSRVPVVGDDVDDIRGILYFKDVVARTQTYGDALDLNAEQMSRPAEYTVEMKLADDMLRHMQATRSHMAIVIDEYGGVAGLLTLEDILEEVVGELTDEHDHRVSEPEEIEPGVWRVPSRYPISELGELLGRDIEDEDVDSVGGLLTKAIGRVPLPGARGSLHGVSMLAEEAQGRRRQVGTILCRLDPEVPNPVNDLREDK